MSSSYIMSFLRIRLALDHLRLIVSTEYSCSSSHLWAIFPLPIILLIFVYFFSYSLILRYLSLNLHFSRYIRAIENISLPLHSAHWVVTYKSYMRFGLRFWANPVRKYLNIYIICKHACPYIQILANIIELGKIKFYHWIEFIELYWEH